jgi:hypothetical protein
VADEGTLDSSVGLSDAIGALRRELTDAWWDGQHERVRFKVEPVELTVQVGVTKTGTGEAGVKWHILTIGGSKSKETSATQTLRLRLAPVFYDGDGKRLRREDQLVSGPAEAPDYLDEAVDSPE